jgi:hypothetical protein
MFAFPVVLKPVDSSASGRMQWSALDWLNDDNHQLSANRYSTAIRRWNHHQ